ncbi:hypothetical protein ACOMHN_034890 [Nucella lapillus]
MNNAVSAPITIPGANIAAAWASLQCLGEDGFMQRARELMDLTDRLKHGIHQIDGLTIIGEPHMTAFAVGSNDPDVNILAVADVIESRGWKRELLADLADSVVAVRNNQSLKKKGTAGIYGMMATIPDKTLINDFITEFFSEVYSLK